MTTAMRSDVFNAYGQGVGFAITCTRDLPPEALALDQLVILARDEHGRTGRIQLTDGVRGPAFTRLLMSAPAVGVGAADAILSWLAANPRLHGDSREAIGAAARGLRPASSSTAVLARPKDTHEKVPDADRKFWFRFESLGRDCIFGLTQRHFAAEPLGLLRFTAIGADAIASAIEGDFAGVGTPPFTRLIPNEYQEYMSSDTRHHMWSHTTIFEGDAPYDALFQRQCQKLRYLARNLVEDIAEGSKIFVVHNLPETLDTPRLDRLAAALRAKGPGWLLYASRPDADHPAGSARQVADRVIHGRVLYGEEVAPAAAADSWRDACRQAAALVDAALGTAGAAAPGRTTTQEVG